MIADPKTTAARAFVRSLNILLKFARLYGYEHIRTIEQLQIAGQELHAAMPVGSEGGLLLGATGSQLLLDGVPLDGSPAEKQFAQLLSAAGLSSVQFFASVTDEELGRFARAFPTGKAKPSDLALQLKAALAGAQGIRINETCFVATDSRLKEASMAAQIAAASLGGDQDEFRKWLNDPQKLLELIAAAQGSHGGGPIGQGAGGAGSSGEAPGSAGTGIGGSATSGGGAGGPSGGTGIGTATSYSAIPNSAGIGATGTGVRSGSGTGGGSGMGPISGVVASLATGGIGGGTGGNAEPSEEEIYRILGALTSFGQVGTGQGGVAAAGAFQEQMAELPGRAQDTLKRALATLAAQAPSTKPDESVIVQLAEHLAIRFALERFERGEVKVNAVRQMLDRMNQEIENLRKILGAHEDKMSDAGLLVETHREILDRQFWAAVPDSGKREVLLSGEAWCIPPKNVQSYVGELIKKGDIAEAISILQNYAACAESDEADARKKTAAGLSELAELYGKADPKVLGEALRHLGVRLSVEQDAEVQTLVSAAFVRLTQEAATNRYFPAMEQALDLIAGVESQRPGIAHNLRGKMGIEERVPDFVDEALRARHVAAGLTNVLKLLPQTTMEQLAVRFNRCSLREDSDHVANLAADLGEEAVQCLRGTVRGGPIAEAVEMTGLLSRLDPESVMVFLPMRVKDFPRTSQDRVVRQISASGATRRCHILLELLDHLDPLVMPLVIDEIGVTADREALSKLLTMADGDLPEGSSPYLRVKAIEALGRINAPESVTTLKRMVETKKMFGWFHPQELRIAALQALFKLDAEWAGEFLVKSGIEREDMTLAPLDVPVNSKFVRQRRHTRVRLQKPVRAVSLNLKENCSLEIKTASLNGGVATISRHLAPGTQVQLKLQIGMRNLQATALMRDYRAQDMSFEIVDMNLEERSKYRRMLAGNLSNSSSSQGAAELEPIAMSAPVAGSK
ncbi:MAG TPA: HEAT repeat domain-containing protein [Candidatus Acidoferrum sp.]|nr:HEAT repeat domain-containing protein [Candidatus Acidoferrum sp.]